MSDAAMDQLLRLVIVGGRMNAKADAVLAAHGLNASRRRRLLAETTPMSVNRPFLVRDGLRQRGMLCTQARHGVVRRVHHGTRYVSLSSISSTPNRSSSLDAFGSSSAMNSSAYAAGSPFW